MPPHPPTRSTRIDRKAEDAALAALKEGRTEQALKILVVAYGNAINSFTLRLLRNTEAAKDVRQAVFFEAFQGISRFEGRSSLWSWLCAIAYHRSMDELKRNKRASAANSDVWISSELQSNEVMDEGRVQKRRALDHCLGKLEPSLRAQVIMRMSYEMSYAEIGEAVGDAHGTVQVRLSRVLPKLRKCLKEKGFGYDRS